MPTTCLFPSTTGCALKRQSQRLGLHLLAHTALVQAIAFIIKLFPMDFIHHSGEPMVLFEITYSSITLKSQNPRTGLGLGKLEVELAYF
jgi:hypothetical protein